MLRKVVSLMVLAVIGLGAYGVAPMIAAWQIREAVVSGDTGRLRDKVDWPAVRQSLKSSLGETRIALTELSDAAGLPRPSLWQRMKAAALPYLADPLIDRYVSAEGAPKLYAWRQTWKQRVAAARGAAQASAKLVAAAVTPAPQSWHVRLLQDTPAARVLALIRRVERWSFVSPTRIEIEVADRIVSGRTWHAVMEMQRLSWRLTGMKVVNVAATRPFGRAVRAAAARH